MGMFDEITVKVPLPDGSTVTKFQTKSLECYLEEYEIREDGTLWQEEYDTEDQSDPNAEGIMKLAGIMTRVNQRWVQITDYTGEIKFGRWDKDLNIMYDYSTYFVDGILKIGPLRR